jgi:hypothetical protein
MPGTHGYTERQPAGTSARDCHNASAVGCPLQCQTVRKLNFPEMHPNKINSLLWQECQNSGSSHSLLLCSAIPVKATYTRLEFQLLQPRHDGIGKRFLVVDEPVPSGVRSVRIRQRHERDVWH